MDAGNIEKNHENKDAAEFCRMGGSSTVVVF
jgi:hypothetical protein